VSTQTDRPARTEATPHDFRRTKMLDRFHLHTLNMVLESFARLAGTPLSTVLRQPCTLGLRGLDQVTWADLSHTLDEGVHLVTFSLPPAPGWCMVALPTAEALAIVELRLAGSGDEDQPERILTEIEQELLAPVVISMLEELSRALARLQATRPVLEIQESNIQFVSIAPPGETTVAARFDLSIGARPPSEVTLCVPLPTARHLVEGVDAARSGDDPAAPGLHEVQQRLDAVPVELVLEFPSFESTPDTLLSLGVGDELHLGQPTDRPLELRAEGQLVARATIGRSGVRKACCITEEVLS
jgi:flagellar motor switch protein FliM